MVRLGLQLTLRSGREAMVRLVITAAAVAVGVALLLGVLAEYHAFQANANQACWSCTTGQPVPSPLPSRLDRYALRLISPCTQVQRLSAAFQRPLLRSRLTRPPGASGA